VSNAATGLHFVGHDGNGNVTLLAKGSDGTSSAQYEYGPFGELLRRTGTMATNNCFRFSTKYQDEETDLLYYGFRYYNPCTGRWLSRDPIGERGGKNLYGFVGNQPIGYIDDLGKEAVSTTPPQTTSPPMDWDALYNQMRDSDHYSPLKACQEANRQLGQSKPCSSLGRAPEPKLYCGCSYSKILAAAQWLRQTGDGRPAGSDKLAHCYAFCVAASWYTSLVAFFANDSDPNDIAANMTGSVLGMTTSPCNCLPACAAATANMRFD
jgi:RHS repeat-associated protein